MCAPDQAGEAIEQRLPPAYLELALAGNKGAVDPRALPGEALEQSDGDHDIGQDADAHVFSRHALAR